MGGLVIYVLGIGLLAAGPVAAAPQADIQVIAQSVESHFPDEMTFTIQLGSETTDIVDGTLYYRVGWEEGERIGRPAPFTPAAEVTLTHVWDTRDETVPPFMEVSYYWQVVDGEGRVYTTPPVFVDYVDRTRDWQTLGNDHVAVYWYGQPESFGSALFEAADQGYDHVVSVVGISTERQARVVIYRNQSDFCSFFAPNTCQDWIGGQAHSGLTVQWGTNLDWFTYNVVPHELAHVFYAEVFRDTWVRVPTWFNEGIAVYNERTDHRREMVLVTAAAADGDLIPLRHMGTQASGVAHDSIGLWYAEAYSLVAFIADAYGEDKLGEVILTLAENHPMEETLELTLGMDLIEYELAWRDWLGYPVDSIPMPAMPSPPPVATFALPTVPRGAPSATSTPDSREVGQALTPTPERSPASTTVPPSGDGPVSPDGDIPVVFCCGSVLAVIALAAWVGMR